MMSPQLADGSSEKKKKKKKKKAKEEPSEAGDASMIEEVSVRLSDLGGQGSHRLEKYLNLEGFLEKSLKMKSAFKSTEKSLKSLEKSLNSTIFCRT